MTTNVYCTVSSLITLSSVQKTSLCGFEQSAKVITIQEKTILRSKLVTNEIHGKNSLNSVALDCAQYDSKSLFLLAVHPLPVSSDSRFPRFIFVGHIDFSLLSTHSPYPTPVGNSRGSPGAVYLHGTCSCFSLSLVLSCYCL